MDEVEAVREAAGLEPGDGSLAQADAALGEVLVLAAQRYLKRVSNEWDVELFFETYGRPPRDGSSWSRAMIDGLNSRPDFPEAERQALIDEAVAGAVSLLQGKQQETAG